MRNYTLNSFSFRLRGNFGEEFSLYQKQYRNFERFSSYYIVLIFELFQRLPKYIIATYYLLTRNL